VYLSSSETLRLQTAQAQKYMQQEQEDAQNEAKGKKVTGVPYYTKTP